MLIPTILAGGPGTRLWPLSRASNPKPFMILNDGETLLRKTYERINRLSDIKEILTITNQDYFFKCQEEYEKVSIGQHPISFILEPCGRNTAAAVAFAALHVQQYYGPEAILLILPADHLITDHKGFNDAITHASTLAYKNKLVTFGIKPTHPETGFGYIECGEACGPGYIVSRFIEKPNLEAATQYISQRNYLWNAGIFCFTAEKIMTEFQRVMPNFWQHILNCWAQTNTTNPHKCILDASLFPELPDISLDYAIMEKSSDVAVIKAEFNWNDIGSWEAMSKIHPQDAQGNSLTSHAIAINTKNTYIHSENRVIATIGIDNLIIVDTPDALLIADKNDTQAVKNVVQQLKTKGHETYKSHQTMSRPWGSYTILEESKFYKIYI